MNDNETEVITLAVEPKQVGLRLDVGIATLYPKISRSTAQRLIREGAVLVDGGKRPQGYRLGDSMTIQVTLTKENQPSLKAEPGLLDIVYEDDHFLAISKKAGMVVHPGAGHASGTLVNVLLASGRPLSSCQDPLRAGLVHRLDRETSGILLIAKTNHAHAELAAQFAARSVRKIYLALVLGKQLPQRGTIHTSFGRQSGSRKLFTGRNTAASRDALTHYAVLARSGLSSFVAASPVTGRTHQIRVHLAESGAPIVGDRAYGRAWPKKGSRPQWEAEILQKMKRHALHSWSISFLHPETKEPMSLQAPLPRDFENLLTKLFEGEWQDFLADLLENESSLFPLS